MGREDPTPAWVISAKILHFIRHNGTTYRFGTRRVITMRKRAA